ncbi:hypothetical protein [Gimesia panareensis]|uniref:hypothetical protein n=1 Tax=Gimesia panareensis TaxID=2527978 RepID=UPI00118855F8|nr:hypothetical protein [Gimesia panareensis]QDU48102.1 hypothetical protein Pan110_04140 [Gimesia panareensis]
MPKIKSSVDQGRSSEKPLEDVKHANPEPPNWVEIGTLGLAVIIALGGGWKFYQLDKKLSTLDTQLKQQELDFNREKTLQVTGHLHLDRYPQTRVGTVELTINNIRKTAVQIEDCELVITPVKIPDQLVTALDKTSDNSLPNSPEGLLHQVEEVQKQDTEPERNELAPQPSKLTMMSVASTGELSLIEVDTEPASYVYDPKEHSGGRILAGQQRQVAFDMLLQEGTIPSLFKVAVTCRIADEELPYTWETWIAFGGFPNRPGSFQADSFAPH